MLRTVRMRAPVSQLVTLTLTSQTPSMLCLSCADKVVCKAARLSARIAQILEMLFIVSISFSVGILGGGERGPGGSGQLRVPCLCTYRREMKGKTGRSEE